ncbi:MAG: transketolase [Planctomycetes bacterium]|nr:transketolase [Planctomycetota bacterium]
MTASPAPSPALARLAVNTLKMLAADAVEAAASGHPGLPMGAADHAFVLWSRFLRVDPSDPSWPDRDRYVLSAGHGSMLLYALLHLAGFELALEDLKAFRQLGSRTPGHPEHGETPGVEITTGPLGQGFAAGVGMALARRLLAERMNTGRFHPVSHRIFGLVSDGDLMEGVAAEAASLAGHLGLGALTYLYDDNRITIEGATKLAFSENVPDRFRACGWHVQSVDGHDHEAIAAAIEAAVAETERPSLICARTHIAHGSPGKQDSAEAHGAPLGAAELVATKRHLGWPLAPAFHVPEEVRAFFRAWAGARREAHAAWTEEFEDWARTHPKEAALWHSLHDRQVPDDIGTRLLEAVPRKEAATRQLSGAVLQTAAEIVPALIGGSADLAPSNNTALKSYPSVGPGLAGGRNLHFGVREHAMGAIMNGLALHGTAIPYGGTFLVFSDYLRPAIRLAALMRLQVIYVFTHDSIFLGEDGPTHQPVEHLAALRAIPGLAVIRPADAEETAAAWAWALRRRDGPTALVLTRQAVPRLERAAAFDPESIERGAYAVRDAVDPELIVIGTGSEIAVALGAAAIVSDRTGCRVRVVSMPSVDRFLARPAAERSALVPPEVPAVAIEAGVSRGWGDVVGRGGLVIGLDRFGASGPFKQLAEHFGFTPARAADRILAWLGSGAR